MTGKHLLKKIVSELDSYRGDLDIFSRQHVIGALFARPTAIGWKVADLDRFNEELAGLLEAGAEQVHIGNVNDRFIASAAFNLPLSWDIRVVKLMQLRPGSSDPVGLDHVDFLCSSLGETKRALKKLDSWETEANEAHEWISLRFSGREAKFFDHTVIDVGIKELEEFKRKIQEGRNSY